MYNISAVINEVLHDPGYVASHALGYKLAVVGTEVNQSSLMQKRIFAKCMCLAPCCTPSVWNFGCSVPGLIAFCLRYKYFQRVFPERVEMTPIIIPMDLYRQKVNMGNVLYVAGNLSTSNISVWRELSPPYIICPTSFIYTKWWRNHEIGPE